MIFAQKSNFEFSVIVKCFKGPKNMERKKVANSLMRQSTE